MQIFIIAVDMITGDVNCVNSVLLSKRHLIIYIYFRTTLYVCLCTDEFCTVHFLVWSVLKTVVEETGKQNLTWGKCWTVHQSRRNLSGICIRNGWFGQREHIHLVMTDEERKTVKSVDERTAAENFEYVKRKSRKV